MYAKLASALLVSVVVFSPGLALADPPDHCPQLGNADTRGNLLKDILLNPGQAQKVQNADASDRAAAINLSKKTFCPTPLPPQ